MSPSALNQFLASLPKTETHLHIEGALPWELLIEKDPVKFTILLESFIVEIMRKQKS
jgi:adenosine deaminase